MMVNLQHVRAFSEKRLFVYLDNKLVIKTAELMIKSLIELNVWYKKSGELAEFRFDSLIPVLINLEEGKNDCISS